MLKNIKGNGIRKISLGIILGTVLSTNTFAFDYSKVTPKCKSYYQDLKILLNKSQELTNNFKKGYASDSEIYNAFITNEMIIKNSEKVEGYCNKKHYSDLYLINEIKTITITGYKMKQLYTKLLKKGSI